jgi:hypothetical protein
MPRTAHSRVFPQHALLLSHPKTQTPPDNPLWWYAGQTNKTGAALGNGAGLRYYGNSTQTRCALAPSCVAQQERRVLETFVA